MPIKCFSKDAKYFEPLILQQVVNLMLWCLMVPFIFVKLSTEKSRSKLPLLTISNISFQTF